MKRTTVIVDTYEFSFQETIAFLKQHFDIEINLQPGIKGLVEQPPQELLNIESPRGLVMKRFDLSSGVEDDELKLKLIVTTPLVSENLEPNTEEVVV